MRKKIRVVLASVVGVVLLSQVIPAVLYVAQSEEGLLESGATWARDHGYGSLVDKLEEWKYSSAPEKTPATRLGVSEELDTLTTNSQERTNNTTATSTTEPWSPAPLKTPHTPQLPSEGEWRGLVESSNQTVAWITSLRPSKKYGAVRATYVRFKPTKLKAVLYNGTKLPGGNRWERYKKVSGEDLRTLSFTFNGGFRFEHTLGGYKTEGITVKPLIKGQASVGIRQDGEMKIGVYGRDFTDGPEWVSIRQNLTPIVDGSASAVTKRNRVWWGTDHGGKTFVPRSALCDMNDGTMMWAIVGDVNAPGLADALVSAGCKVAVQLDINGTWPHFAIYEGMGTLKRTPRVIDTRMSNPGRYIKGSEKDFFAFFIEP